MANRAAPIDARATAARRWSFLHKWLTELHKHLSYNEMEEPDCLSLHSELKDLCIYLPWPPRKTTAYHKRLVKVREAMELVGMMLRVDQRAWQLLTCPKNDVMCAFDADDYDASDLDPHFLLKAYSRDDYDGDSTESIAACTQLLLNVHGDSAPVSYAYERAREKIIAMDTTGRLTQYQLPITIVLSPEQMRQQLVSLYFRQATELVNGMVHRSRQPRTTYPFCVSTLILQPWAFRISTDSDGECAVNTFTRTMLALGVRIAEVALTLEDPAPVALSRLMASITQPFEHQHDHGGSSRPGSVDALMVTNTSLNAFTAVCSSLVTCKTFAPVQFYAAFDDATDALYRREKWKWLGYALLSSASRSVVEELSIEDGRLLLSDVHALTQTAATAHPIQQMSLETQGSSSGRSGVGRAVQLASSARLRLHHTTSTDISLQDLQVDSGTWLEVINDATGTEWIELLVPGYGRAWARSASIVYVQAVPRSDCRHPRPPLRSLHLGLDHCERGALALMVLAVGANLVSLDISVSENRFVKKADVAAIIDACPRLEMLRLERASLGSMELFTRAYEEKRWRLRVLALCNVDVSNASLHAFAKTLSNPTHVLATTLQEFRLIYNDLGCVGDVVRPDAIGMQLFLDMLLSNSVLSFLEIALDDAMYEQFKEQFAANDGRLLVSHASHLPLRVKVAFVSCFTGQQRRESKRARGVRPRVGVPVLSKAIVGRIFSFARKRLHRVVSRTEILDKNKVKGFVM